MKKKDTTAVRLLKKYGFFGSLRLIYDRVVGRIRRFEDGLEGNASVSNQNSRQVFIFATVPYYDVGGGQRSAQLAKTFAKMGLTVHYVFAQPSSESVRYKIPIPTSTHKYFKNFSGRDLSTLLRRNDIAIFEIPYKGFLDYLPILSRQGARIVYENIDNWDTTLGRRLFSRKCLVTLLKEADLLTATTKSLAKQLENYIDTLGVQKEVVYMPNAVDDLLFDPTIRFQKPKDMIYGKKTLLYYGSLWGSWFDWDLIYSVALAYPNFEINLIGDYGPIRERVNNFPKNVHFLGALNQTELPAYLMYSDIAILPFKLNDIGEHVSPLKIFEYIAMNKIVVSTPLPDIRAYPNVLIGQTIDDWVSIFRGSLPEVDIKARNVFISKNNWLDRCKRMIE